ncbi:MAG: sodium:calcium exchanger [Saccharothrix sp.]|nr:sodium:calcium exchanger [Saccharothrix sp.]
MRKPTSRLLALVVLAGLAVPGGASTAVAACAPAAVDIGDVALVEGTAGTTSFKFPVTVTAAAGCQALGSVRYRTVDGAFADRDPGRAGSDYTATSGTLTWQGDTATRYVTVAVAADAVPELTEVFWVSLDLPSGVVITGRSGAGWITDDDGAVTALCDPAVEDCGGDTSTEGTGVCWRDVCTASVHFLRPTNEQRQIHVRTLDNGGTELGYTPIRDLTLVVPPGGKRAVVRFTITARPDQQVRIPVEFFALSAGRPGNLRTVLTLVK